MGELIPLPRYSQILRATMGCLHSFPASGSTGIWNKCRICGYEGLVVRWEVVRG